MIIGVEGMFVNTHYSVVARERKAKNRFWTFHHKKSVGCPQVYRNRKICIFVVCRQTMVGWNKSQTLSTTGTNCVRRPGGRATESSLCLRTAAMVTVIVTPGTVDTTTEARNQWLQKRRGPPLQDVIRGMGVGTDRVQQIQENTDFILMYIILKMSVSL